MTSKFFLVFLSIILVLIHLNHQNSRLSHWFPWFPMIFMNKSMIFHDFPMDFRRDFRIPRGGRTPSGCNSGGRYGLRHRCGFVDFFFSVDAGENVGQKWWEIPGKSWENLDKIMEMLENDVKFLKTFLEFDKYWKMMIHDDHMFFSMRSPLLRTSPLFCSKTNLSWLSWEIHPMTEKIGCRSFCFTYSNV